MDIKRILFPTDLSNRCLGALDNALDLAISYKAELHILYVEDLRDLGAVTAYSVPSFVASLPEVELKDQLETSKPSLRNVRCQYHYILGAAADEICALAKRKMIDLIVMSTHGRTGLSRVFLGSVAEAVMRKAICPVLVVKQSTPGDSSHIAHAHAMSVPGGGDECLEQDNAD